MHANVFDMLNGLILKLNLIGMHRLARWRLRPNEPACGGWDYGSHPNHTGAGRSRFSGSHPPSATLRRSLRILPCRRVCGWEPQIPPPLGSFIPALEFDAMEGRRESSQLVAGLHEWIPRARRTSLSPKVADLGSVTR